MFAFAVRCLACGVILVGVAALVGCETLRRDRAPARENTTGVPATANRVGDGRGELSHRADANGTIYLYAVDTSVLLDRQRLRKGQRYTIDPNRSIATIDGKTVWNRTMNPKHTHRLYFDRDR